MKGGDDMHPVPRILGLAFLGLGLLVILIIGGMVIVTRMKAGEVGTMELLPLGLFAASAVSLGAGALFQRGPVP